MTTPYLNKYQCTGCAQGQWAVGNPLQCQRCGGTMIETQQGTTPLTGNFQFNEAGDVSFDWDGFNNWWEDVNAR